MDAEDLFRNPVTPRKIARRRAPKTAWERLLDDREKFAAGKPLFRHRVEKNAAKKERARSCFYDHNAPTGDERELKWRHYHWQLKRTKVREALAGTGVGEAHLNNFDNCGA